MRRNQARYLEATIMDKLHWNTCFYLSSNTFLRLQVLPPPLLPDQCWAYRPVGRILRGIGMQRGDGPKERRMPEGHAPPPPGNFEN